MPFFLNRQAMSNVSYVDLDDDTAVAEHVEV